jgi:hypothetical protein
MISVIVLHIGIALVVTAGFTPGPPPPPGNIFRNDQFPGQPAIFKNEP